jgi:hypothetical protein
MNKCVCLYNLYEIPNDPSESRENTATDLVIPVTQTRKQGEVAGNEGIWYKIPEVRNRKDLPSQFSEDGV